MNEIDREEIEEIVKESIESVFFSDDEYSPFNRLNEKINHLLTVQRAEERLDIAIKNADKLEDYMKNADKLNMMINEFKGLVSIVRGEAKDVQKQNASIKKRMIKILEDLAE